VDEMCPLTTNHDFYRRERGGFTNRRRAVLETRCVISIWQDTSFRSRPPCLSPLRWIQSARAYAGMHPAVASGTPLCLFLEFHPTHGLSDKFRDNSPTRVFLSDSCGALYKDSYLSERLVRCHQVVCCFDACMLLNLKEMVGANGFEPSTSWSRTRNEST
jgi:hypothetical protein